MDPKMHPLTAVVKLIKTIQPAAHGGYSLYAEAHEMHICRSSLVPKDAPVIAVIRAFDINTGLTTLQWNHINARIKIFIKQGILEWNLPKPSQQKTPKNCSTSSEKTTPPSKADSKHSETTQSLY